MGEPPQAAKAPAVAEPSSLRLSAAPGKGLTVQSADERFSLNLRARVQVRDTVTIERARWADGKSVQDTNELVIKTVRLWLSGNVLSPDLRYNIQLALGGGDYDRDRAAPFNATPLFDAWVEHVGLRDLNVRVGQFFVPFDRARTTREFALQLVDRQLVVQQMTLDRDVGLMLSSSDLFGLGGVLGYALFAGGGEGRAAFTQATSATAPARPGLLFAGRLALRPFGSFDDDHEGDLQRGDKPRLAIGVAGAHNRRTNRQNSTYGAVYTRSQVDYLHAAADLVFKLKGLSFFSEWVLRKGSKDRLFDGNGADGKPLQEWSRSGHGFFVQAGMMLTDKLEIAARYDQIFAMSGTDPAFVKLVDTAGKQVGGGVNLYLNGHAFKLQTDYFYVMGSEAAATSSSPPQGPRHIARVQLDATFLSGETMTRSAFLLLFTVSLFGCRRQSGASSGPTEVELLHVSYDPTRELWRDYNERFSASYASSSGKKVTIKQSHGGSSTQARAVIDGLDADVLSLASYLDTDAVSKKGLITQGWVDRLPNRSLPYTSTIVFVVRKGNPKKIADWPDLIRPDVEVITPNPKTSGNGYLSFFSAWGSIVLRGGSRDDAVAFMGKLYARVPVLDSGARGATTTFVQKKIGDVHLAWENEAHLEVREAKGDLELVYPPISIRAEPHVALVDGNVDRKHTREVAEAYLRFAYTDEAQEIFARHFYRPSSEAVLARHAATFPSMKLFAITEIAADYADAHKKLIAEGGVFDAIYKPKK